MLGLVLTLAIRYKKPEDVLTLAIRSLRTFSDSQYLKPENESRVSFSVTALLQQIYMYPLTNAS